MSEIKNKKIVLGLTGGIASGKTTVLKAFKKLGAKTLDCDLIARQVVQPGQPALRKIVKRFGKTVLKRNGSLNRDRLARMIFSSKHHRQILEKIIHPEVIKVLKRRIGDIKSGVIVADIPLLFETRLTYLVDKTVVVWVPESVQLQRLIERNGFTKKGALQRIHSQWPLNKKRRMADYVINNSSGLDSLMSQVQGIHRRLFGGM